MRKITALMDPNQNPNQLQDQETFDTNMANWVDGMVLRGEQENALADDMDALFATMSATAAGGTYSFPYIFDSSTADSDPGVGKLRLSSATQNAATVMRMDLQAVGGADMTNVLADLRAGTSAVKGSIRVVKMTDPSKWLIFDVTAVAIPTGYRNLTMTWRATGGGLASPFANGDALMIFIDRNGDKGDLPLGGALTCLVAEDITAAAASINYLSLFTSNYDHYRIDLIDFRPSTNGATPRLRFASGGAAIASANYSTLATHAAAPAQVTGTSLPLTPATLTNARNSSGLSIDIMNVNSANSPTIAMVTGFYDSTASAPSNLQSVLGNGILSLNQAIGGFQIFFDTGNIAVAKLRVYGYRNQTGPGVF